MTRTIRTRALRAAQFPQDRRPKNSPLPPRFAFVKTPVWDKADAETREAFEELAKELGEACFTFDLPDRYAAAWDAQRAIMAAEMAHNLGKLTDQGGDKISKACAT